MHNISISKGFDEKGDNYLLPNTIHADVVAHRDATQLKGRCINLKSQILKPMEELKTASVIVVDACRTGLGDLFPRHKGGGKNYGGGARKTGGAEGAIVAFATEHEQSAEDPNDHSPGTYAAALVDALGPGRSRKRNPRLDVRSLFSSVRTAVKKKTKGRQTPYTEDRLDDGTVMKLLPPRNHKSMQCPSEVLKEGLAVDDDDRKHPEKFCIHVLACRLASEAVYLEDPEAFLHDDMNHRPYAHLLEVGGGQADMVVADGKLPKLRYLELSIHPDEDFVIFAFPGTNDTYDMLTNVNIRPVSFGSGSGSAHGGFVSRLDRYYSALKSRIYELLDDGKNILFTGHSLGGAVASLATLRLLDEGRWGPSRVRAITFGQPCPGDKALASWAEEMGYWKRITAFVYKQDIVPRILMMTKDIMAKALDVAHYAGIFGSLKSLATEAMGTVGIPACIAALCGSAGVACAGTAGAACAAAPMMACTNAEATCEWMCKKAVDLAKTWFLDEVSVIYEPIGQVVYMTAEGMNIWSIPSRGQQLKYMRNALGNGGSMSQMFMDHGIENYGNFLLAKTKQANTKQTVVHDEL